MKEECERFPVADPKKALRQSILSLRDRIGEEQRRQWDERIRDRLLELPAYREAEEILFYASFRSEVSTGELCQAALEQGKKVFFPKVLGEEMEFYRIRRIEELAAGYRGIREPAGKGEPRSAQVPALILVPGAVFSVKGYRIGYGKGFYDRYLTRFPHLQTIGLCYGIQLLEDIPHEEHDKPVESLVTEETLIYCKQ